MKQIRQATDSTIYEDLVGLVTQQLGEKFSALLAECENQFLDLADQAKTNQQVYTYIQMGRDFKADFAAIKHQFFQILSDEIRNKTDLASDQKRNELRLVSIDVQEKCVAVGNIAQHCEEKFSTHLYQINKRLASIYEKIKIDQRANPIGPYAFCYAFSRVLEGKALECSVHIELLYTFGSVVLSTAEPLYDAILELLQRKNIFSHESLQSQRLNAPRQLSVNGKASSGDSTFMDLVKIKCTQRHGRADHDAYQYNAPVDYQQVMTILDRLQHKVSHMEQSGQAVILPPAVIEKLLGDKVSENNKDVIEIVGMLFSFMLEEKKLDDAIKANLSFLHTPILKVAIIDAAFINDAQHPAKRLLNTLIQAGVEFPGSPQVIDLVRSTIDSVLKQFKDNVEVFSIVCEQFEQSMGILRLQVAKVADRTRQKMEGEENLAEKRQIILQLIEKYQTHLPSSLAADIAEVWQHHLMPVVTKFGIDSEQMNHATELMIASIPDADNTSRWSTALRAMSASEDLISQLMALTDTMLNDLAKDCDSSASILEINDTQVSTVISDPDLDFDDTLHPLLTNIEYGTVFDLINLHGEFQRMRLAWFSPMTKNYLFTDARGREALRINQQELSEALYHGAAEVIEEIEKPFFERALASIKDCLG